MDWTNIYDETGEEELIFSEYTAAVTTKKKATRVTRLVSAVYQHHHQHHHHRRRHSSRVEQPPPPPPPPPQPIFVQEEENEEEEDFSSHRLFLLSKKPSQDFAAENLSETSSTSSSIISYSNYTLSALYCLSINYILGVGCLGVPYAFARAGFILCGCIILLVSVTSYVTVMWVAECGCRLEYEFLVKEEQHEEIKKDGVEKYDGGILSEDVPLLNRETATISNQHFEVEGPSSPSKKYHQHKNNQKEKKEIEIDPNSYEVIDLVRYYLGNTHGILYQISLMSLMYIGLLAYSQVFCNATSALILPSTETTTRSFWYRIIPQLVFGSVVVPLSCAELNEQVSVQAIMAVVRFVAIFIMVGGSGVALFIRPYHDMDESSSQQQQYAPYFAPSQTAAGNHDDDNEGGGCEMSYTACFNGFGVAFSTALFSQLFQHSVPGLLRPLEGRTEQVKKVPLVFGLSLTTTCTFYLILGMSAASYFGADTKSSVNLNFANFTFGLDPQTTPKIFLALCKFASSVVVMFPALDTLSVFPLIANTLGSNLLASSGPGFVRWVVRKLPLWKRMVQMFSLSYWRDNNNSTSDNNDADKLTTTTKKKEEKRKLVESASKIATIFWRLVAAFPPLLGSIWATDLSFSLLLAGVAGVYVAFFAPSLMQLASCRREYLLVKQTHKSSSMTTVVWQGEAENNSDEKEDVETLPRNVYTGWYSRTVLTYPVLLFATFALGVVLVQIRDAWIAMRSVA